MEQLLKDKSDAGNIKTEPERGKPSFMGDDFNFEEVLRNFEPGGELNLNALTVTGHWSDGYARSLTLTDLTDLGDQVDIQCVCDEESGEYFITIVVDGKTYTFKTVDEEEKIEIVETDFGKIVSAIIIESDPDKTVYAWGEALDLAGLLVKATYKDNSEAVVDIFIDDIRDYHAFTPGSQIVTIYYKGKTATFDVSVADPILTGVVFNFDEVEKNCECGTEPLDLTGLVITEKWQDRDIELVYGENLALIDLTVIDYDAYAPGSQTVTVIYKGYSDSFGVTVKEPVLERIDISEGDFQVKLSTYEADLKELLTGRVTAIYSNGDSKQVDAANLEISTLTIPVVQSVIVSYEGVSASIIVTVTDDSGLYLLNTEVTYTDSGTGANHIMTITILENWSDGSQNSFVAENLSAQNGTYDFKIGPYPYTVHVEVSGNTVVTCVLIDP